MSEHMEVVAAKDLSVVREDLNSIEEEEKVEVAKPVQHSAIDELILDLYAAKMPVN